LTLKKNEKINAKLYILSKSVMETKTTYLPYRTGLLKEINLFINGIYKAHFQTAWIHSRAWPPCPTYEEEDDEKIIGIWFKEDEIKFDKKYKLPQFEFNHPDYKRCSCVYKKDENGYKLSREGGANTEPCPDNFMSQVAYKSWLTERLSQKNTLVGEEDELTVTYGNTKTHVIKDECILHVENGQVSSVLEKTITHTTEMRPEKNRLEVLSFNQKLDKWGTKSFYSPKDPNKFNHFKYKDWLMSKTHT
jgi:hypothetical protein